MYYFLTVLHLYGTHYQAYFTVDRMNVFKQRLRNVDLNSFVKDINISI